MSFPFELLCETAEEMKLRMPVIVKEAKLSRKNITRAQQSTQFFLFKWMASFNKIMASDQDVPAAEFKASQIEVSKKQ